MSNLNKVTINKSKLLECIDIAENLPDTPKGEIEITENGTYNIAEYANATVNVVGDDLTEVLAEQEALIGELKEIVSKKAGINVPKLPKDVNFYDYDGTLLHSYTVEEAQALTELPELPTQEGLICQGWNWSLEDIKAHGRAVNIGATYITDDGKTRLYINIATDGRMTVPLNFKQDIANGVTIDWGDGSDTETVNGIGNVSITHTYASIGDYIISFDVSDGCLLTLMVTNSAYSILGKEDVYRNMLKKVQVGVRTVVGQFAFQYCRSLLSITIPNGITSFNYQPFFYCTSLSSITIPNSVTTIDSKTFSNCRSLSLITIPNGVTSIGSEAFCYCVSLASIVIPNSVTQIVQNAFENCSTLSSIVIPDGMTTINSKTFSNCISLSSITIPKGVMSIKSNAFYYCYALASIVIPNGVPSIGANTFQGCGSLASIVIPNSVTQIDTYAFYGCSGMAYYDFTNHTAVPTLFNADAFKNIPSDCEIRVPAALYEEWVAATNWATYADYIVSV